MTEHLTDTARLTYSNKSMSMEPGNPEHFSRGKDDRVKEASEKKVSTPNRTKFEQFLAELDPEDRKKIEELNQRATGNDRTALETTKFIVNKGVLRLEKEDVLKMIFGSDESIKPENKDSASEERAKDELPPHEGSGGDGGGKEPPAPPGGEGKDKGRDGNSDIVKHLKNIESYTGEISENTREMLEKLDRIIELNEENIRTLIRLGDKHIRDLTVSLGNVSKDKDEILRMSLQQDERREAQQPEEMKWITSVQKEVQNASDFRELINLVEQGPFFLTTNRIIGLYKRDKSSDWGNPFGDDSNFEGTPEEFEERAKRELQSVIEEIRARAMDPNANLDSVKQFILDKYRPYVEMFAEAARSGRQQERGMRRIENIEQLAQAIMETHPDFGPDTDQALLDKEGNLRQNNFIKWIRNQLIYYHNQDPDNPQINFFSSISVDLPDLYRSVHVLQMINNPGVFFRDRFGNKLQQLQDEVTREVWLFGDIRNKNIAYLLSMPLDERIGEVLMNMYQNNVLTKVADEGKTPLYWLLTMSENFTSEGKQDVKVGMALNESLLMYYNLTDFPELYENYAGEDSPLFNLNQIKETVKEILKREERDPSDTYFTPEYWGNLAKFFNPDGTFKYTGDTDEDVKYQIAYVKDFLNIFAPEQNPRIIDLVRALVQKTIQQRLSMTDDAMQFAETFSQFFLRFTLTAARADLGAPAMDAGEKVARIYNQEKGPNATNPGYANVKAVDLMRALAVDFFRGTYVLDGERKDQISKRLDGKKSVYAIVNGEKRYLSDDEEIRTLEGNEFIQVKDGLKIINKRETYITVEEVTHPTFNNVVYKEGHDKEGNRILVDANNPDGEDVWNEAEEREKLLEKHRDKKVDIFPVVSFSKARGQAGFTFNVKTVVRDWQLDQVVGNAQRPNRVIVKRAQNAQGFEIVQELGSDVTVVTGTRKNAEGKEVDDTLDKGENITNKVKIFYDLKNNPKHYYELGNDETYDISPDGAYYRLYKKGELQGRFAKDNADIRTQKYVTKKRFQGYSTYQIMDEMHRQAMNKEFQDLLKRQSKIRRTEESEESKKIDEAVSERMKAVDRTAQKLQYKADTMRQYSSNHLNRAFQMFHEMNQKHLIDVRSLLKGYDDKKGFVFDESQLQDIFTEQLYKRRRYAYRTYLINMSEIVRGISHDKNQERFQTMRLAEHLFGPKVLNMFVMSNGEIDWEFLSTPRGVGELFKTELIMRLAAEEAQLDDLNFPEARLTLQAKIAYRKALARAIASDQKLDDDSMRGNRTIFNSFGDRMISEMQEENRNALDFMDVYEAAAGNTERGLIEQEMIRGGAASFGSGLLEAAGIFVKETVAGELD